MIIEENITVFRAKCDVCKKEFLNDEFDILIQMRTKEEIRDMLLFYGWSYTDDDKTRCDRCTNNSFLESVKDEINVSDTLAEKFLNNIEGVWEDASNNIKQ